MTNSVLIMSVNLLNILITQGLINIMSIKKTKLTKRKEALGVYPSPEEILAFRLEVGMSTTEAAAVIYRTVRNWQQWESAERKMDPALWELFRIKVKNN